MSDQRMGFIGRQTKLNHSPHLNKQTVKVARQPDTFWLISGPPQSPLGPDPLMG